MKTGNNLAARGESGTGSDTLLRLPSARGHHFSSIAAEGKAGPQSRPLHPLRIALVSTSAVSTPPRAYGGTELFVAELAKELCRRGHEVVTFATGDSTCQGELRSIFPKPVWPPSHIAELRHAAFAWDAITRQHFDIVHINSAEAMLMGRHTNVPSVLTLHHDRVEDLVPAYKEHPDVAFVAISQRQADLSPEIPFAAVIHHGLDPSRYPAGTRPNSQANNRDGAYCAFLGRLAETKAPHLAIDVARQAGLPIRLGGGVHPFDRAYYESQVAPRLGDDAIRLGELGHERKVELLQGAECLIFPIVWEEPFGLVMIESMLVGTPVVAFGRGSAKEIVDDGVTGFVVGSPEEMVLRVREIGSLDRNRCRQAAQARWSSAVMAARYEALYYSQIETRARIGADDDALRFDRDIRSLDGERDESHGYYEPLHAGKRIAGTVLGG